MEIIKAIHPKVLDATNQTISEAQQRGMKVGLQMGVRDAVAQDRLYSLGRTLVNPDGKTKEKPMGTIITNAKGWESWHCFGLAVDLVFKDAKGNWTWNKTSKEWGALGAVGKMFGLSWGGDWTKFPDFPHFQRIGTIPNIHEAKRILEEKGIDALWSMI